MLSLKKASGKKKEGGWMSTKAGNNLPGAGIPWKY
jgi:hypothetical protein